jgi:carbon monoxide dehydrogenase subunit G
MQCLDLEKMHFEGTFDVKASKEHVYDFLLDPNRLAKCLPDLQKMEVESEDRFKATVRVGISFIKGNLNFQFSILDKNRPSHARLVGHGSGMGSTIDLDTVLDLTDGPGGGTSMSWKAEAKIGGQIASVGQRLIGGQAEKQVKQLFDCLKKQLEA